MPAFCVLVCVLCRATEDSTAEGVLPGGGEVPAAKRCDACRRPKHGKKRFCVEHNRGYDCMRRIAATKQKAEPDSKAEEEFKNLMADPIRGPAAVDQWTKDNPSGLPGKRRGGMETSQFVQSQGSRTSGGGEAKGKYMDFVEYTCYMERKRKWSTEESQKNWHRMKSIKAWPRDFKGEDTDDPLRLMIPKGDYVFAKMENFEDKSLVNASKAIKNLSEAEAGQLMAEALDA